MQGQVDGVRAERAVQPAGNGFASAVRALVELLSEGRMRIGFGQDVSIAVLVEGVLQWVAMRGQLDVRSEIRIRSALLARGTRVTARELAFVLSSASFGRVLVGWLCGKVGLLEDTGGYRRELGTRSTYTY